VFESDILRMHVRNQKLDRPCKSARNQEPRPCCIPAPGLGLHAAATVAATAAAASACGCRLERSRSFGLSFERLCSPRESKGEIQDEAGVKLKWAGGKDTKRKKGLARNQKQSIVRAGIYRSPRPQARGAGALEADLGRVVRRQLRDNL
jgi:hypothetical protein